jgi:tetratricopeptide (TPR) repeat protein
MKNLPQFLLVILVFTISGLSQSEVESFVQNANKISSSEKFAEAAAEMSKAIEIEPANAKLYIQRARFYQFAKDEKSFYKDVDQALKLDADNEMIVMTASRLLLDTGNTSKCEEVMSLISAYISKHSQSDVAYDMRFRAKTCTGDITGAYNDVSTAMELNPQNVGYRTNRANLLSRLGDSKQALELFQLLINSLESKIAVLEKGHDKTQPNNELAMTYLSRAKIHERNGDEDLAIADLTKAVELVPNDIFFRARAFAYKKSGKFPEAIADLTKAIYENSFGGLYAESAEIYILVGKYDDAIADYKECIKLIPSLKDRIEQRITTTKQKQLESLNPK